MFSLVNYKINGKLHDGNKIYASKSVPDSHVGCRLPGNGMPSAVSGLALKAGLLGSRERQLVGRGALYCHSLQSTPTSSSLVQVPE